MKTTLKRTVAVLIIAGHIACAAEDDSSAQPRVEKHGANVPREALPAAADEDPEFQDPAQGQQYYEALLTGERRAFQVISEALQRARADSNADRAYLGELERKQAEYGDRIRRHEANLASR